MCVTFNHGVFPRLTVPRHQTLYLVEAFGEVGADLSRLVFDVRFLHSLTTPHFNHVL